MKKMFTLATVSFVLAFMGTSTAMASHHHEKAIKEHIKRHYKFVSEGEMEKRIKDMHSEAVGFGPDGGLLREVPSGKGRKELIKKQKKEYEQGERLRITPKHIRVMVDEDGNSAFATYYTEGTRTEAGEGGEKEQIRDRVTLILRKEEGKWRGIHWHISPIESAGEDD